MKKLPRGTLRFAHFAQCREMTLSPLPRHLHRAHSFGAARFAREGALLVAPSPEAYQ